MGQPVIVARELLRLHHDNYRDFWKFAEQAVDYAMLGGSLNTVFGWHLHPCADPNPRSLQNFPMQAHGAEMMRLACCLGIERDIEICAPVHDAILICAPLDRIEADVAAMRAAMAEASRAVLDGFEVRTDVNIIRWPDRYMDDRGVVMWQRVMELLARFQRSAEAV